MMVGLCQVAQGNYLGAAQSFRTALSVDYVTKPVRVALHYELGETYYLMGDYRAALVYFRKVQSEYSGFRNVEDRILFLRKRLKR